MRDYLCKDCINNKNGWCKVKSTNKGLKEITSCQDYANEIITDIQRAMAKLMEYKQMKEYELKIENTGYNKGVIKGLDIALQLLNDM